MPLNSNDDHRIAIIGGGAAAALLLHAFRTHGIDGREVVVIDPGERTGPGVAYGTADPVHLMNVCRTRLSVDGDGGSDLTAWLEDRGIPSHADTYLRRSVYGDYLARVADRAAKAISAGHRRARVAGLHPEDGGWLLALDDGSTESVGSAILATGFPGRASLPCPAPDDDARVVVDPWAPGVLDRPDVRRAVIVGTGLTMVDVALSLASVNPDVEIVACSRRGLLPRSSRPGLPSAIDPSRLPAPGVTGRELVRQVVAVAREEESETGDWQAVIDTVRPRANELWRSLSLSDQARILRRWFPWWNIHRHRTAPAVGAGLDAARRRGQLQVRRGRVAGVEGGARLTVRLDGEVRPIEEVDLVVNAAGPSDDLSSSATAPLRSLLVQGQAAVEPHGLGLAVDPVGRVLDARGRITPGLWAIGALRRGTEWETTAVPELRVQATEIVRRVLEVAGLDDPVVEVGRC